MTNEKNKETLATKKKSGFSKLKATLMSALMTINTTATAFAAPGQAATNAQTATTPIIAEVLSIVCLVFIYVGIVLLVYAFIQLISATRNEDAEGKVKSTQQLVAAVVLIALKPLLNGVLSITGTGIQIP